MESPAKVVKKLFLLQVGALSLLSEKAENFIKELEEKGKISEEEGKKFINQLKKNIAKQKEELSSEIGKLLKEMNIPTRDEIEALKEEIRS